MRWALLQGVRGVRGALGVGLRCAVGGQHRAPRRDIGGDPQRGDAVPDALGAVPLIGADRGQLGADRARALEQRHEGVALVAVGRLAPARHAAAHPGIDRDLRAMDQMRTLTGLVTQPGVGIGLRRRGGVGAAPLRGRSRPRLGQHQPRARALGRPHRTIGAAAILFGAGASAEAPGSAAPSRSSAGPRLARRLCNAASAST
jgi:hypothetical protein